MVCHLGERLTRVIASGSICLAVIVGSVACGGDEEAGPAGTTQVTSDEVSAEVETVVLSTSTWIGAAPLFLADEREFDKANGIELELKTLQEQKDTTAALGARAVDGAFTVTPGHALTLLAIDVPTRIVLLGDISTGGDAILAKPEIESIADLAGKRVALSLGAGGEYMMAYALTQNGLTWDDINVLDLSGADAATALNAGEVDAAYTFEPYITQTVQEGFHVIFAAGDKRGIISDLLVVTEDFAENEPNSVISLMKTWEDGVQFMRSNPDEAYEISSEVMEVPLSDFQELLTPDVLQLTDVEESLEFFESDWSSLAEDFIEILRERADLPREITLEEAEAVVDMSFARAASEGD